MLFATGWQIFPASGRDIPHQADFPRVDFQPLHAQPRYRPTEHRLATDQYAGKGVTPQELLTHLRVAELWYCLRFIHPQCAVHLRQLFFAHPVGQKAKIPHHPEELLRDVLFQARQDVPLCQRLCGLLTRIVVMVAEAQCGTAGIVCQSGAGYRRLFQVTAQVFHGVFAARRFFRHIHMPVIATGTQYQAAPLRVGGDVGEGRWQRDTFRPDAQ